MKKLFTILAGLLLCSFTASADDRPITSAELPSAARQFIEAHYPGINILYATADKGLFDSDYSVGLDNGTKIEFSGNGLWTEVSNRTQALPATIIPAAVADFVAKSYPKAQILKIERDNRSTEVRLDNGLELKFSTDGRLLEIDD